jgi:16S rRNA U1498 N3-methylase RsmE
MLKFSLIIMDISGALWDSEITETTEKNFKLYVVKIEITETTEKNFKLYVVKIEL